MTGLEGLLLGVGAVYLMAAGIWTMLVFGDNAAFVDREKYFVLGCIASLLTGLCWLPIIIFAICSNTWR